MPDSTHITSIPRTIWRVGIIVIVPISQMKKSSPEGKEMACLWLEDLIFAVVVWLVAKLLFSVLSFQWKLS